MVNVYAFIGLLLTFLTFFAGIWFTCEYFDEKSLWFGSESAREAAKKAFLCFASLPFIGFVWPVVALWGLYWLWKEGWKNA